MKKQSRILALFAALFLAIVPLAGMAQSIVDGLEVSLNRSAYDEVLQQEQLLREVRNKLATCNTIEDIKAVQKLYEVDNKYGEGFLAAVCTHPSYASIGLMQMGFIRAKTDYYQRLVNAADLDAHLALRSLLTAEEFDNFASRLTEEELANVNKPLHQGVLNALAACTTVEEIKAVQAEYDARYGDGFAFGAAAAADPLDEAVTQAFRTAGAAYFTALVQAQSVEAHEASKALLSEAEYAQFTEMLTRQQQNALTCAVEVIAARVCSCGFGGSMEGMHESDCGMRQYFEAICEKTAEEMAAYWLALTPAEQNYVMSVVDGLDSQKGIALRLQLGIYTLVENELENGCKLSILGALPSDIAVTARMADLQMTEHGAPLFAIDVQLLHGGEKYTLPEGEKLTVTLDVQALGLEEGTKLNLYHIVSAEKTEYLQMSSVVDGKVSFQTDGFSVIYATEPPLGVAAWEDDNYIYLDLFYGDIKIDTNGFTMTASNGTQIASGEPEGAQTYYIYQSASAAEAGTAPAVAQYDRVENWANIIYGNKDVDAVSREWGTRAAQAGRTPTSHRIDLVGSGNYVLTLDNIWSNFERYGTSGTLRGGINNNTSGGSVTLQFKNDNRVSAIHKNGTKNQMVFNSDADSTLTVASHDGRTNFWNAAIGNNDGSQTIYGLVFNNGHVYAGTRNAENCTAIGAGGNGYGEVTINGGTITAICATSGTAIGGGIGYHSAGGNADVTITGGKVFAYNGGYKGSDGPIPAAAIGGGSSYKSNGNAKTNITISGGEVYAEAVHGVAIGGGGSGTKNGGKGTVTISGNAKVTARSVAGTVHGKHWENGVSGDHGSQDVEAGASIGGGTGRLTGGDAVLTISGSPTIITGSIGGGKATSTNGTIGSATVTVTGGKIQGQVVMAAGSATECEFTMNGGTIDNSSRDSAKFIFIEENGGAVFVENGKATVSGSSVITGCSAQNGGAIYVTASGSNASGVFEMQNGTIEKCSATANGGAVCIVGGEAYIKGGKISSNSAQNGGAVSVTGGKFDMSSGELTGNYASAAGGAVYINGGTSSFTGGTLSGNGIRTANGTSAYTPSGGAVYVENTEVAFGVADGTGSISITQNYAQDGAGFYLKQDNGQNIEIYNGTISQNTASGNGGGIYQTGNAVCNVNGGVVEQNNAANGAGLYINGSIVNVDGGEISGNTAIQNGGGVYATGAGAECTVTGGDVKDNSAASGNGGGFYVDGGELSMQDGTVLQNTAANGSGGGAYVNNATVSFGGEGAISVLENSANNGGGFYVDGERADVTVSGGTIGQNTATQSGGGMYVAGGTFSVAGGTISSNKAQSLNGGGVVVDGSAHTARAELTGGKIIQNTAAQNGGGVYTIGANARCVVTNGVIGSAVQADEDSPDARGSADKNVAQNGAGLFVGGGTLVFSGGTIGWNEASLNGGGLAVAADGTNATATIQDGYIGYNKATACGGGIYMDGTTAETTISNNITITENQAANGGGVHLRGGSDLTVIGGFIMKNHARGAQLTNDTAYQKDELAGVGGGVSVAGGTDTKATHFTLSSGNVGLYDNSAGNAADDVFASGQNTLLTLPATADMELSGEYSSADGWYEDYVIKDSGYASGWGGEQSNDVEYIVRYRTKGDNVQAYNADITAINTANKYVCLTLGVKRDGVSDLTITKQIVGSELTGEEQPMFVFTVKGKRTADNGTVEFIVPIRGAGSVTVEKVPHGEYTITEDMQWAWRYECVSPTNGATTVTLDPSTVNTGVTVVFQNRMKTENPWIEGSISKDNKYEISTGTGGESK